jgi:hypothetical protein
MARSDGIEAADGVAILGAATALPARIVAAAHGRNWPFSTEDNNP